MLPLHEIDLLGIYVSPVALCVAVALPAALLLRRLLDRTAINRVVRNRALVDLCMLICIGSLLVLSLRFGA